jgi:hypothetical protein
VRGGARAQAPSISERREERFFCYRGDPHSAPRVVALIYRMSSIGYISKYL